MDFKQIRAKKPMKLLFLLLTALVIGTASATVYNYMYISGTVTIGFPALIWIKGSGAPSGSNGSTAITGGAVSMSFNNLTEGQNQTYTYCLYLKNNSTQTHSPTITVTNTELLPSLFYSANIYLYTNSSGTWTFLTSIGMTTVNSYQQINLAARPSGVDRLDFQFYPKNTTASGQYSFGIQVTYG